MEQLFDLFTQMNSDLTDPRWKVFRSFFTSAKVDIQLDLGEHTKKLRHWLDHAIDIDLSDTSMAKMPFVTGRIKEIKPTIHELKVFKGDQELISEAHEVQRLSLIHI